MLYQFAIYPRLAQAMSIVLLQNGAVIVCIILYPVMPNVKWLSWDESSLLVVSVLVLILVQSASAGVSEYLYCGIYVYGTTQVQARDIHISALM